MAPRRTAARRAAPYGPNTCVNGYVWRAAAPGDLVCVAPPRRQQARNDNAQAAARRNSLHVWLTLYRPSQQPCTGDPCSQQLRRRAALPRPRRSPQRRHGDRDPAPDRHRRAEDVARTGQAEPERARRPARVRQRHAALLAALRTPTSRCATPCRCGGRPARRCGPAARRCEGGPSARRRPCGKGAGGAPRCLVQAAAGRNGAAWATTRRRAEALSRVEEGASLSRLEGFDQDAECGRRCANAARRCARGAGNPTCA